MGEPKFMKNIIAEATEKQYLVTTTNGKKYLARMTDQEKAKIQARGATVQDPATGATGTSGVLEEAYEIQPKDVINIAKQLAKAITESLRDHGDSVSRVTGKDLTTGGVTIKVTYKPDEEGNVWHDQFNFIFKGGKIILKLKNKALDVCPVLQQSGTVNLQQDLIKNVITQVLGERTKVTKDEGDGKEEAILKECDDNMLLEFDRALRTYAQEKSKENLKNLLKAARSFPGDDIQHKLKAAADAYNCRFKEEEGHDEEAECPEDMHLEVGYALFLRLMEYAKEDAKTDLDLHYVAERLSKVSRNKGCATMKDYEFIVGEQPEQEIEDSEEEVAPMNEAQGLKSQKLYDLAKQHGGFTFKFAGAVDRQALTDEDIAGTLSRKEVWQLQSDGKLRDWAKKRVTVNPEDIVDFEELKDGTHVVVVNRNAQEVPGKGGAFLKKAAKDREREINKRRDGKDRYMPDTTRGRMARDLRTNPFFRHKTQSSVWSNPEIRHAAVQNIKNMGKDITRHELEETIFECYAAHLREEDKKRRLVEDQEKDNDMIYSEGEVLPDATDQMLAKFPTLRHALVRLQTENFPEFVAGIDYISPKPTEFRINLKNGQNFILKWMGKDFEATISGKKYYLGTLVDFQKALDKLSRLYQEGPMGTDEEGSRESGSRHDEAPTGGGGGEFPGSETSTPEEGPEEKPEETAEEPGPEGESGEETEDLSDETVDFEGTETI